MYLFIAEDWRRLKIGHSKTPNIIFPRFKTALGDDMVVYVWDMFWDSLHDWRKIEADIFYMFNMYRLYTKGELFNLYKNGRNLLQFYRKKITEYFKSTQTLQRVYEWGIVKRRHSRSDTFP